MNDNQGRMYLRPKPGEDEDEILNHQEEFLRSNVKPAASVVNKRKAQAEIEAGKKQSRFARERGYESDKQPTKGTVSSVVLGEIKEKNIPPGMSWKFTRTSNKQGFPETFIGDSIIVAKGQSIFSQQMRQQAALKGSEPSTSASDIHSLDSNVSLGIGKPFGDRSYILSCPEALQIHEENVQMLSKMTADEIKTEQEKLKLMLEPQLLAFVKSLRKESDTNCNINTDLNVETNNSPLLKEDSLKVAQNMEVSSDKSLDTCVQIVNSKILQEEANNWLHMNVVEQEKLGWMGDIPSVKPVSADQEYSARFDFEGLLMPYAAEEVDVRQGLYNHGDEPERPGYTIEELYQLSRSSVSQQRVFAINTIAGILGKIKMGYYDECLQESLLSRLLDHELFTLLRFALDDNTESQLVATLLALKHLLSSQPDELCLDRALGCSRSINQPSLAVVQDIRASTLDMSEVVEAELKDYQIMKLDIVKGALRTDLILRLRYILEILKPCPKAVISTLEILTRLVRHSQDTAMAVTCCPRLLRCIVTSFVPPNWKAIVGEKKPSDMESVYNVPLVHALKLLRIISCRSRTFASDLVHKYFIMNSIVNYISVDPRECSLPYQEVLRLSLESLYLWQTFLAYNLATRQFVDLYPVLMRLLQFHYSATSASDTQSTFGQEHAAALISLIEQAVHTAHYQHTRENQSSMKTLSYCHVKDFTTLLEMCLAKWLAQLSCAKDLMFSSTKLTGATLNCLSALYCCHIGEADVNLVSWLSTLENIMESQVLPFLRSEGFNKATGSLKPSSCLLYKGEVGSKRDPSSLPSLGALMWGGQCMTPVLQPNSSVPLVHGLSNFLLALYTAHKGLDCKGIEMFCTNQELTNYCTLVANEASALLGTHWFTRFEVNMATSVLRLVSLYKGCRDLSMFHHMAFRICTLVQKDEIYLLKDTMDRIIFNVDFFKDCSSLSQNMAGMQIIESPLLSTQNSRQELVQSALQNIPAIWACYEEALGLSKAVPKYGSDILNFTATEKGTDIFLPVDWPYLPIIHLHSQDKAAQRIDEKEASKIVKVLQWVLLVEWLRPNVVVDLSATDRFCRLATVFLAASDLFLQPQVHGLLASGLASLMQVNHKIKFPPQFYDLYTQLLEQFAAVSYGDPLFGLFILVPLQQRHSPNLRKQVWSEHAAVLRILSTSVDSLMFPMSEMLEPCETDTSLLLAYLHCLATGSVREQWSPILYRVAVHHVATFIQLHQDTTLAQQIRSRIDKLGNKELQSLLLNYKRSLVKY